MIETLLQNRTVQVLIESFPRILLPGLAVTIPLTVLSVAFAMVIAAAEALAQFARGPVLRQLARVYIWVVRGTPLLVQLFIIFYGLPSMGIVLDAFPTAVIAFSINGGAYFAATIRAALEAGPSGPPGAGSPRGGARGRGGLAAPGVFPAPTGNTSFACMQSALTSRASSPPLTR